MEKGTTKGIEKKGYVEYVEIGSDTRNVKVEAPEGYSTNKLIPRVYVSAMDLGVL